MRTFLTASAIALALLIIGLLLGAALVGPQPPSAAALARETLAIERARALQPAYTFAGAVWAILPPVAALGVVGVALWGAAAWVRRSVALVRPDDRGLVPVPRAQLDHVAPAALGAFHSASNAAAARPLPLGDKVTLTVHQAAPLAAALAPPAPSVLSSPSELLGDALPAPMRFDYTPTARTILLGYAAGGAPVTVPSSSLFHVGLVGSTGGGKSNLQRVIMAQLLAVGAEAVIADPHFAEVDAETGDDLGPIVRRLSIAPASSASAISDLFAWAVGQLDQRLETRRAGGTVGRPLLVAVDELPIIAANVPGAIEQLARLLREGRKARIFVLGASQSMLVKAIGGDSSAREAFRTACYVGGDLYSAAALLDMQRRDVAEIEGELGQGVALVRSAAAPTAQRLRVPLLDNAGLVGLLGGARRVPSAASHVASPMASSGAIWQPDGSQMVASGEAASSAVERHAISAEAARVAALFAEGKEISAIVAELRGIDAKTGGRRYQTAASEVQSLLRQAMAS